MLSVFSARVEDWALLPIGLPGLGRIYRRSADADATYFGRRARSLLIPLTHRHEATAAATSVTTYTGVAVASERELRGIIDLRLISALYLAGVMR